MKRFSHVLTTGFLSITLTMLFSACVKTVVNNDNPKGLKGNFRDGSLGKRHYKKLKDYYLVLYPVGNTQAIVLNDKAVVNLRLRNFARKKIRIDEWYMDTPDNVVLYYRPFDLKIKKFEPAEWKKVSPEIKDKARHYQLELMPKNSVLVSKNLDFFKDVDLQKGETKKFLMLAELNLHSVNVRSSMFSIEIKKE
ncbi:MAG: hypothetical protein WCS27_13310 [Victivallaceae bacterium]